MIPQGILKRALKKKYDLQGLAVKKRMKPMMGSVSHEQSRSMLRTLDKPQVK